MLLIRLNITPDIHKKLKERHKVKESEIEECFLNREKAHLIDTREEHETDPPTKWFIAETDTGRLLKIMWINDDVLGVTIKSAYEPSQKAIDLYNRVTASK